MSAGAVVDVSSFFVVSFMRRAMKSMPLVATACVVNERLPLGPLSAALQKRKRFDITASTGTPPGSGIRIDAASVRRNAAPSAGKAGAKPMEISGEKPVDVVAKAFLWLSARAVTPSAAVVRKRRRSIEAALLNYLTWNDLAGQEYHAESAFDGSPGLAAGDGALDHRLVDGDDVRAGVGGVELDVADDAAEGLAQRARAEALLAGGVPGDCDQGAASDLQVDAEALEVGARRAEHRRLRLDEDAREVGLGEVVEHDDRFEARDELRRHAVAKEVVVFEVVAEMERQLLAHFARRGDDDDRLHRRDVLPDCGAAEHGLIQLLERAAGDEEDAEGVDAVRAAADVELDVLVLHQRQQRLLRDDAAY